MSGTRFSSLLRKITVLFVICYFGTGGLCLNTALALDGSGTQEDPWLIQSLEDFNDFAADPNYWDDYTRLETDVNLAGRVYERAVIAPDVSSLDYYQGTKYTGIFDGNDHKIMNLTIDDGGAGNDWLGLFGSVDNGEVRNLGLEGGSVSGLECVGGLVGGNDSSISNCYSTGYVSGGYVVGGLVGGNGGSISDCYSISDVNGVRYVGGLVGGNVGRISNCYSTGAIKGVITVGGLAGTNSGSRISNCYSTSHVNGNEDIGGLVGCNRTFGYVWNCYSSGDLNGINHVGGLVGWNDNASISNCFWDTETQTHGVTESIGENDGLAHNVLGLPTAQLHLQSTFTDWDFIDFWNIGENQTYPYLRVYLPSDINKDGIVNFLDIAIAANQWMQEQ